MRVDIHIHAEDSAVLEKVGRAIMAGIDDMKQAVLAMHATEQRLLAALDALSQGGSTVDPVLTQLAQALTADSAALNAKLDALNTVPAQPLATAAELAARQAAGDPNTSPFATAAELAARQPVPAPQPFKPGQFPVQPQAVTRRL